MALPVIALSRQRGTGGDVIAALVAHELGLPLYDRQVLAQAAAKAGVSPDTIAAAERRPGLLDRMLQWLGQSATSADYRRTIATVLQTLAAAGPAVIVGHAAGQVALRDRPDVLRVFLHAPVAQRVARMQQYGQLSQTEAEADVRRRDQERAAFFQEHYGLDWYDLRRYDLVLNTGGRDYPTVAADICRTARHWDHAAAGAVPPTG